MDARCRVDMKQEQERLRTLLLDTVTLLCKNAMTFNYELKIKGVIGVTFDEQVFIVLMNESFTNEATNAGQSKANVSPAAYNPCNVNTISTESTVTTDIVQWQHGRWNKRIVKKGPTDGIVNCPSSNIRANQIGPIKQETDVAVEIDNTSDLQDQFANDLDLISPNDVMQSKNELIQLEEGLFTGQTFDENFGNFDISNRFKNFNESHANYKRPFKRLHFFQFQEGNCKIYYSLYNVHCTCKHFYIFRYKNDLWNLSAFSACSQILHNVLYHKLANNLVKKRCSFFLFHYIRRFIISCFLHGLY